MKYLIISLAIATSLASSFVHAQSDAEIRRLLLYCNKVADLPVMRNRVEFSPDVKPARHTISADEYARRSKLHEQCIDKNYDQFVMPDPQGN